MTVEIGTKVAVFAGYDRRIANFSTIAKIYKNGNIVLDGSSQQYRGSNGRYYQTGGGNWNRTYIEVVTPEIEEEYKAQMRSYSWSTIVSDLSRYRGEVSEQMLSAATALKDLTAKEKP